MGKGLYKLKAFVLILYFVIVCTYVSHVKLILRINMFKLNYGRYYILVLYLTHIAQINDRSKWLVVERILRDPDKTCVFMAPAITGSFDTGS